MKGLGCLSWLLLSPPTALANVDWEAVSLLQRHRTLHSQSLENASLFSLPGDTIYHVHIPKTAGISFGLDSLKVLSENGLHVASREGCYAWQRGKPRIGGTSLMLRDPRKHVLSQFDFCSQGGLASYVAAVHPEGSPAFPKYFPEWVQAWAELQRQGWHGDFTPPTELVSDSRVEPFIRHVRTQAWQFPPFSAEYHSLDPYQWPRLDGGGTCWHFVLVPFQCYVPISLQSQRLVCETPLNYTHMPSAEQAVRNMQEIWFVGLVEAYEPSICLLHVKLGHPLPEWCECTRHAADLHAENYLGEHTVNLEELPQQVQSDLDELVAADLQLYKAARVRFLSEISQVEEQHGVQILCKELREQLEA